MNMKHTSVWKTGALIVVDSLIVAFSVFISYLLLQPFYAGYSIVSLILSSVILFAAYHIFAYVFNLYHRAWEYASVNELKVIVYAVTCAVVLTCLIVPIFTFKSPFLRLYFVTWMMLLILIGGSRISLRMFQKEAHKQVKNKVPTLVVGGGRGGSVLVKQMVNSPDMDMDPVLIVDDDPAKQNLSVTEGIKVRGVIEDIPDLVKKYSIEKIVIAIPTLKNERLQEITDICEGTNIEVFKMPNLENVMSGKLEVNQLKKIQVEDLLEREPVELDMNLISQELTGKTIMVTGAGGSIGSEICRQVCKFNPKRIVVLGHGENSIYLINQELNDLFGDTIEVIPIIADIKDANRIQNVVGMYQPYVIYHAAAHKHVPLMEYNPREAIINNILGTRNLVTAARDHKAKKFVMVSTDKAVNPTNVMGATKRVAEMIVQSMNEGACSTDFAVVRFGNVLGSRGSVIPLFKKQIERGGPVTVTHPDMQRYFMTIPEAARLVLQAGALANGGEVFVLDMGKPVKIMDLAKNVIKMSGFTENEIGIKVTGIRPGEKMYEEIMNKNEIHPEQVYEKIYRGKVSIPSKNEIDAKVDELLESQNIKEDIIAFINETNKKNSETTQNDSEITQKNS